jgi:hypothetical protein
MARRSALEQGLIGPAGEHFVLYQLYRRGVLAAAAPPRTPVVDLLVLSPDGETIAATLQVKTRSRPTRRRGWMMSRKHETLVDDRMFYAFVDLAEEPPGTWIIPSAVVAEVVRESHGLWLAAPGRRGQTRQDSVIRQVRNDYPNPPHGYPAGWMDSYRERWELLLGVVDEAD